MFQKVGLGQVEKRKEKNRIAVIDDIAWQGSRERS